MAQGSFNPAAGVVGWLAARLRFPQLFLLAALLFLVDLLTPDPIPFADEILLGLLTVLLGSLRNRPEEPERPPMKSITPRQK